MNKGLTADRAKIWAAVAVLGLAAMSAVWYSYNLVRSDSGENARLRKEPDYFIERFNYIKISNNGKANYHVSGKRLQHLPVSEQIEIFEPLIHSYAATREPVVIRADRALVEQKSPEDFSERQEDKVFLHGRVEVTQAVESHPDFMQLTTNYLLLLPDADTVTTDQQVDILTPRMHISAVGMEANQTTQQVELHSKVRAQIQSRQPARQGKSIRNPS